jgi:hypothetical protein
MRLHYDFDRQRFLAPRDNPEEGYGYFLGSQLRDAEAAVFVADRAGDVVGYVYRGPGATVVEGAARRCRLHSRRRGGRIASRRRDCQRAPRDRESVVEGAPAPRVSCLWTAERNMPRSAFSSRLDSAGR